MYILLVLVVLAAVGGVLYRLLFWTLEETVEESDASDRAARERNSYNPHGWTVFNRLFPQRPPLLGYRRDKRGRFRKLP
jgi:hypothetical protein